jgi:hypothetical protein
MQLRHTDWIQDLIFDLEGYKVVKAIDLESKLTKSDYESLLNSLDGKTLTIDKDGNILIFYSDIAYFEITI